MSKLLISNKRPPGFPDGPYASCVKSLRPVRRRDHAEQHGDREQCVDAAELSGGLRGCGLLIGWQIREFALDIERTLLVRPDHEPDVEPHNRAEPHADT